MPRYRVFISYRREDASADAVRIFDSLREELPDAVFLDVQSIGLGADFTREIEQAVDRCDVLLALIGPRWATSSRSDGSRRLDDPDDFVRREVGGALLRSKRVIPVLLPGATMPAPAELPTELQPLARRHALTLRNDHWADDVRRLISAIREEATKRQIERDTGHRDGDDLVLVPYLPESDRRRDTFSLLFTLVLLGGGWFLLRDAVVATAAGREFNLVFAAVGLVWWYLGLRSVATHVRSYLPSEWRVREHELEVRVLLLKRPLRRRLFRHARLRVLVGAAGDRPPSAGRDIEIRSGARVARLSFFRNQQSVLANRQALAGLIAEVTGWPVDGQASPEATAP